MNVLERYAALKASPGVIGIDPTALLADMAERVRVLEGALLLARNDLATARDEIFLPTTFAETLAVIDAALATAPPGVAP
jgi:hypothetical protein